MAILGIDEVGRGPWAGPLVIGAVILPEEKPDWIEGLTDSKKLSKKKREELNEIILREAPATGLGWVSSRELDSLGMSNSLKLAARRAVENIRREKVSFTEVVIDGTVNFLAGTSLEKHVTILKKADFLIKEVSAASIIAKVARDNYMEKLAEIFPEYGFETHVGYGTAAHQKAIENFGIIPEHRQSFKPIAKIVGKEIEKKKSESETATEKGKRGETIVVEYLEKNGHEIISRNFKTPFYEIDIISLKDDHVYFTEVKYRKNEFRGTALEMITPEKLKQMTFAAESFLKFQPSLAKNFSPLLAAAAVSGKDFNLDTWFSLT